MIFCVEDDDGIRELMIYALGSAGFSAKGFADGVSFFSALEEEIPELVLLDIMLPGEDGISILKRLRGGELAAEVPVIMATARGTEYDKVIGLDLGADDYMAKPFGVMELISRVKALLRRAEGLPEASVLSNGGIILDTDKRRVTAAGEPCELTFKEFELLRMLLLNQGIVLSRDKIMEQVWGFDYEGESRTVDMHIKTLRQKLGTDGRAIKTVRNVGYVIDNL